MIMVVGLAGYAHEHMSVMRCASTRVAHTLHTLSGDFLASRAHSLVWGARPRSHPHFPYACGRNMSGIPGPTSFKQVPARGRLTAKPLVDHAVFNIMQVRRSFSQVRAKGVANPQS